MDKVVADDWAFARTNSASTTTINATGDQVAEGNWKIARYCFSTTNPPR